MNTYLLQAPADQNLSLSLGVLLSKFLQNWLLHARRLHEGGVCLDNDVALLQPLRNIVTRAPRVNLILADSNLPTASTFDVLFQLLEVLDTIVGHTQRPNVACLLGLHKCAPCAEAVLLAAVRRVDQQTDNDRVSCLLLCTFGEREQCISYRSM
jgi:hypothetical protein